MNENIITFSTSKEYLNLKSCYPTPCKLNIPDWFKNLNHDVDDLTVKGCMPFLDSLTAGYILKIPADIHLNHNFFSGEYPNTFRETQFGNNIDPYSHIKLNINKQKPECHPTEQLKGCPMNRKNKDLPYHKILNPWAIKTPPGYSCLFLPPMNNTDDRFSIIPGIVDTDTFPTFINFPFTVNGDKYPSLKTIIKQGTPYVQVIPFKRQSWKMKVEGVNQYSYYEKMFFQFFKVLHSYKLQYWNKKSWK
tara:strand:+ start:873 stop:1616 length:744 start_codon:yes stop_codon:yes gene_type:complete